MDGFDPWEYQYIRHKPERHEFAFNDVDAYERYPEFRWIYDKYRLHKAFNEVESSIDQVHGCSVIKPRFNLHGLAEGLSMAVDGGVPPGFVAQPRLDGVYRSTDFFCEQPMVVYRARMWCPGEFYLFWRDQTIEPKAQHIADSLHRAGYRGYLNVETIGGQVIEAHLRPSLQFWDRPRFSMVFRRTGDAMLSIRSSWERDLPTNPDISSVQLAWYEHKPLSVSDPNKHRYRYLVVNGEDLRSCYDYGLMISSMIVFNSVNN